MRCCCCKVDSGPFVKVFAVAKNKLILNVKIGLSSLLTFQSLKNINGNINDKKCFELGIGNRLVVLVMVLVTRFLVL